MTTMTAKQLPKMIDVEQAIQLMRNLGLRPRDSGTIIAWIKKYDLGHKVGGNYVLIEERWHAFLLGEYEGKERDENGG